MIRVPSITIHRPWPALRLRGRGNAKVDVLDRADQEMRRKRLGATVERERNVAFSAHIDGRPIL